MRAGHRSTELTRAESLCLLGSVSVGRIVFSQQALPAIRLVNHLVDDGDIIIGSDLGSAVSAAARTGGGLVVAYEADAIDPDEHRGWSVTVTGTARLVQDPQQLARYQGTLATWVTGATDQFIGIHPEIVAGIRLDG